jgi:hypothetical protein
MIEREKVIDDARREKISSPETFLGSGIIKIGLAKNHGRCQPALNEVSLVAH